MTAVFLSASVPVAGRGNYHETANPFLIQAAVREFVIATIRQHQIVWGGHPSITPMIWTICEDLGVDYAQKVVLYQSRYFEDRFPEENARFGNVLFTNAVSGDRDASLLLLREAMLSRRDLVAAVFIGGMDGIELEYNLFRRNHPDAITLPVPAPGGAALHMARRLGLLGPGQDADLDFARLFFTELAPLTQVTPGPSRFHDL